MTERYTYVLLRGVRPLPSGLFANLRYSGVSVVWASRPFPTVLSCFGLRFAMRHSAPGRPLRACPCRQRSDSFDRCPLQYSFAPIVNHSRSG